MFTGIIEEKGTVLSITQQNQEQGAVLEIKACKVLEDVHIGDSIAVNGVCLTVRSTGEKSFCADVMPETLRKSNLGNLTKGSCVNLERAMSACGRFGGHIVSGHIDGTGKITGIKNEGNAVWVTIEVPQDILRLVALKGSVAIDGISLTVSQLSNTSFGVSLIPHTAKETTLLEKKNGDTVNIENDMMARYVARLLSFREQGDIKRQQEKDKLIMDFLQS